MLRIHSTGSEVTEQIAERLGRNLKGGEAIELVSDLGGGKTTFVRGLGRGAGSKDHVTSPTFKISNVYQGSVFDIFHYDFYRLADPGLMRHELAEAVSEPKSVIVAEWANEVQDVLPGNKVTVHIKTVSDSERELTITMPKALDYLQKGLEQ